jgi:hypothetical protein
MDNENTNNPGDIESVFNSGVLLDERSDKEKLKDYKIEELVSSIAPVSWVEKLESSWRKFPIFNQDGSGSCVAQTMAKLMGILYWLKNGVYVHFSATHIFKRRINKPSSGMGGVDVFSIAQKGVTLEVLVPSQNMNDSQMDNTVIEKYKEEVGSVFKIGKYIMLPIKDIETVASVIQTTGKGVMLWFYFDINEWNKVPKIINPNLDKSALKTCRHSLTGVDFTLYEGKKSIIIEDSWGFWSGFSGQRVINEDFFKERNFFAAYPMNFVFEEATITKPKHYFLIDLQFSQTSDEIKMLQDILKYEGLFPTNADSTGYYGSVTKKAVQNFQLKYGIVKETDAGYGRVGPKTRAKLNVLYN